MIKSFLRKIFSFLKNYINNTENQKMEDINSTLMKAKDAWFEVMKPYTDSFGIIKLPHPAPMLTENEVSKCSLLANREAILKKMKKGGFVAEVGVQTGQFSRSILDICSPSKLYLIDIDLTSYSIKEKFQAQIDAEIVELHEGDSSSWLARMPDSYFDFIYIDGDHRYEGVKKDVQAAKSKVKEDGFLIFNDYTYWSPCECMEYGVVQAVNELCLEDNWGMVYFALGYYMYCDVALQRQQA
ncbi:hypothetical protein NOS3756_45130 [Nostoc sp. NIES-3756]|uniref:class I SAM-dependent methyltransferase n=1 Tax=Nostoc sp. NIES-3756 TaxID=1751286 RepID=UPI000720D3E3|nr:class I SAM-dependent methyltransferase [Nostoc sp. NIES-3756]BAT55525.1 hypothetical protein NOS3756_45130 [Nostoc sp. NIES-3756]